MDCGSCEFLIDIDKSQDGGTCQLSGTFHKFHNICDMERIEDNDKTFIFPKPEKQIKVVFVHSWKGAGMGDYYCSRCNETVSGNRHKYCPYCFARMYTDEEWERALAEWEAEDEAERAFWSMEGIV